MGKKILLCLAHMSGREEEYIAEAFKDNWVVPLGPNVDAFEADLKSFVESEEGSRQELREGVTTWPRAAWAAEEPKTVVALSAGTAAVHLALIALGVGPGDEVICQSMTFCASCNPIRYLGATPVLIDSEPETWNLDPKLLEEAILDRMAKTGRKPKAIIPVYLYGMPAKMDEVMAVAAKYDIPVVEDAAEGLGSRYGGRVCGTFGRYGVLSFNGNKMITTSGGGALVCPTAEEARRVMFYATQARESYPYYQHEEIGYNYRMSNICAGIGRGQMTVLDEHVEHHRRLAAVYREELANVPGIEFHAEPEGKYRSNYWLNTVLLDADLHVKGEEDVYKEVTTGAVGGAAGVTHAAKSAHTAVEPNRNVEAMRLVLLAENIESRPLWKPMHLQPVYADAPAYANGVSEALFRRGMCLPSGPWVTEDDVRRIVALMKAAIIS